MLKLLESMLEKTIRCPSCQTTFKAPPAALPNDPPEVLPATAPLLGERPEEPPVLEAVDDDAPAGRRVQRSRVPEDRESDRRKALPPKQGWKVGLLLGIAAIVLVLCGGFGTLVFFVGKAVVNAAANPAIPESEWQTVRPQGCRCSVSMPGWPNHMLRNGPGSTPATGWKSGVALPKYHRTFLIAFGEVAPGYLAELGPNPLLALARGEAENVRKQSGGKPLEERDLTWDGVPAREFVMELPDNGLLIERVMLVPQPLGSTAYVLAVEGQRLRPDSPEVGRFFSSLQIDPIPKPNPQPNPNPQPKPRPKPTPTPGQEQLKLIGDRLTIHPRGTRLVRTAPDAKVLAALGEDGVVKLLELPTFGSDPRTYRVRATLPAVAGPFRDLAYDKNCTLLAVVAGDNVHLYEAFTGKPFASLSFKEPIAATIAPSGSPLAVAVRKPGDEGSEIHFWDRNRRTPDGEPLKLPGKVSDLAWSPDGTQLAVAVGGEVRLFHPYNRRFLLTTIAAHMGSIAGLAYAPNSQTLVTVGGDKMIKRWSVKDGKFLMAYEGHTNPIGRPAFSPDGSRLATLGGKGDEGVRLWETATGKPLSIFITTPAQVANLDILRDGRTIVVALRNEPIRLCGIPAGNINVKTTPYGKPTRPEEVNRFDVPIAIQMVRFSPDGKTLATADGEGDLQLLNVADWQRLAVKSTAPHRGGRGRGPAVTFAYGGDGRLVAAAGGGGSARVYLRDGVSGALRSDFPAGDGWVRCLAVSPDGKHVAVGFESAPPPRLGQQPKADAASFVRLWDISGEPKQLGTLEKLPYPLGGLAFGRDGKTIYVAAAKLMRRWRTETREELSAWDGALADLAALDVAADGRVYAAGQDMLIHTWDAEGRHGIPLEGHTNGITGLALTTDGKRLASVSRDGTCRLWDTATGETIAVTEDKSQDGNVAVGLPTFSPDGSLLVVAADYNKVSVLRTERVKGQAPAQPVPVKKSSSEPGAVTAFDAVKMRFFKNAGFISDSTLLTANNIGGLQRWNWPDGKLRDEKQHLSAVHALARSRDGKLVALAAGNAVYLRDGDTGRLRACLPCPSGEKYFYASLSALAVSPQGDLLALARYLALQNGNELIVWDVKEGRQRAIVRPTSSVSSLAFSPDGKTLAAGLVSSNCVALYDPLDLKERKLIAKQKRGVGAVSFSPDGKRLATSSSEGLVKMWDLAEDKELWSKPWSLRNAWRQSVCFSPDGKWLVAAPLSTKHGLVLVDADNGELRTEVTRHPMPNSDPSFSPDGKFLAVVRKGPDQVVVFEVAQLLARMP
jgi:WD40 repeat protein